MRARLSLVGMVVAVLTATAVARQGAEGVSRSTEPFGMRVVASGLQGPWEVTWGPDQHLWVTERIGKRVVRVNPADGSKVVLATLSAVHQAVAQDGLLGLALHPDLLRGVGADYVYVSFTYDVAPGADVVPRLAVRRYRYDQRAGSLVEPSEVIANLPASDDHLGGRLVIGPDRKLYLSIGDQGGNWMANRCRPNRAQDLPTAADVAARDWSTYDGKILRIDLDGGVPPDNPAIDGVRSHVFSYGHRNPLGLVFGPGGRLYESEHGPDTDDEVNLIVAGRNYGWPFVAGFRDDRAYAYANWSANPTPCASLPEGPAPASLPRRAEMSWTHPEMTDPLRTFFTFDALPGSGLGSGTIAPGGLDAHVRGRGIPGWDDSLIVASLVRGIVYRVPLASDGQSVRAAPVELFRTLNRYRDIAMHPDQRTIYVATDATGRVLDDARVLTPDLVNPGSILAFTYGGAAN